MKKLLLLGVGSALMFTMGGIGSAQADTSGTIHKSTAAGALQTQQVSIGGSRCAGCHRAHTAKAEMLLKEAQPALCYSCHGGAGSFLDVVDGTDPNTAPGSNALRGGGFEFALIDGAKAEKTYGDIPNGHGGYNITDEKIPVLATKSAVTSRHQIDGTTPGTMWGNGAVSSNVGGALDAGKAGVTLECASCHDPHGNGNYRILKPVPNDAATKAAAAFAGTPEVKYVAPKAAVAYKAACPTCSPATLEVLAAPAVVEVPFKAAVAAHGVIAAVDVAPVNIPDAVAGKRVYTTVNYWAVADRNVPTTKGGPALAATDTDGYITNVAAWCTTCHTRYLAGSGSYATPLKSADGLVTDATFTYRHRGDAFDRGGVNRPNCIQCHVSHGSNVAMVDSTNGSNNATYLAPDGSTPVLNSRLLRVDNRGTCEMCHNV